MGRQLYTIELISAMWIFGFVRDALNVSTKFSRSSADSPILTRLWNHQVDICLYPNGFASVRYPLTTFRSISYDLFVPKPAYSFEGSFFVTMFSKSLWLAWIGSFALCALAVYIGGIFFARQLSLLHMIYNQVETCSAKKLHQTILALVISWLVILFWISISTFLTAERATVGERRPFKDLNDLQTSRKYTVCVRPNSTIFDHFQQTELASLINRGSDCPTDWNELGKLVGNLCSSTKKIVLIERSTLLQEYHTFTGENLPCRIEQVLSKVYLQPRMFVARPGFRLLKQINNL